MIYFDNSATTHTKPKQVIRAVNLGLTKYCANPGRGGHNLSIDTGMEVETVREKVREFVNAYKSQHIIFTSGCTEALNLAILGTVQTGGHIICTSNDHNSVVRPINHLADEGLISYSIATPSNDHTLTRSDIEKHIKPNTYLICVNHISNVDGMIADIESIGELCMEKCILFLVDGAQSAGHVKLDMQKQHIDLLALAPHKGLYAPQGVGVLATSGKAKLKPIKFGGTGTDSFNTHQPITYPEGFESGTIATPNILGLGAGIDFVKANFAEINQKIDDLSTYLNFELRKIPNVIVYTHPDNSFGVIAFNIKNMESETVCQILNDRYKIYTRNGLQCAPLKHQQLGTIESGVVRVSLSYFNNFNEIVTLVKAVKNIVKEYFG